MLHRSIAILAILCFAFGGAGCESLFGNARPKSSKRKKHYEEVLMPLQTGSVLQRRVMVEKESASKKSKKKKKESKRTSSKPTPAPEATPEPSPKAEEENPTPDRYR